VEAWNVQSRKNNANKNSSRDLPHCKEQQATLRLDEFIHTFL
jgi:hypothetical protein